MLHLAMTHVTREDTAMCTHTWERLAESKHWVCILCGLGPSDQPVFVTSTHTRDGDAKRGTTRQLTALRAR